MVEKRLSTTEAAELVGASPNTVKSWMRDLGIKPPRVDGKHRWDAKSLAVLEMVKTLRGEGRSYESIRVLLPRELQEDAPELEHQEPAAPSPVVDVEHLARVVSAAAAAAATNAVAAQTELAEKYAVATHHIGRLEATVEHLERELAASRSMAIVPVRRAWWLFWK